MVGILSRVEGEGGEPVLRESGTPVAEVIGRLESGEGPADVAGALGLAAADVIAALAFEALGDAPAGGPPLVQESSLRPRLAPALGEPALAGLFPRSDRRARLALAAGLLQVFDHWDASHHAAQEADDLSERAVSAYWHGIAHRREPDAGNASYWFRRVGRHSVFPALASAARPLIDDPSLADRLLPRGAWDPFAFIELCTRPRAAGDLARALQRVEMALLLDASIPG
jgi:uncharacterized protein (DUF433 family)